MQFLSAQQINTCMLGHINHQIRSFSQMCPVNPRFCSKNPSLNDRSLHLAALIHVYHIQKPRTWPRMPCFFYVSLRELHKPGRVGSTSGPDARMAGPGRHGGRCRWTKTRPTGEKLFGGGCGPNGSTAPRRTLPTREATRRGARAVPLDTLEQRAAARTRRAEGR